MFDDPMSRDDSTFRLNPLLCAGFALLVAFVAARLLMWLI